MGATAFENLPAAGKCLQHLQFRRNDNKIGVASDLKFAFSLESNCARGIYSRHCHYFVQGKTDIMHHRLDEIDHARRTAGERGTVGDKANAVSENTIQAAQRKL